MRQKLQWGSEGPLPADQELFVPCPLQFVLPLFPSLFFFLSFSVGVKRNSSQQ